jgi:phenylacetaldehyde dehydrogenase
MNTIELPVATNSLRTRMFINGSWVAAKSGAQLPVYNPATGEVLAHVPDADANDVNDAVSSAVNTFNSEAWRRMPPVKREAILLRLADLLEENANELAELETLNNGKLLIYSRMVEVGASAQWLRYMAGWACSGGNHSLEFSPADGCLENCTSTCLR